MWTELSVAKTLVKIQRLSRSWKSWVIRQRFWAGAWSNTAYSGDLHWVPVGAPKLVKKIKMQWNRSSSVFNSKEPEVELVSLYNPTLSQKTCRRLVFEAFSTHLKTSGWKTMLYKHLQKLSLAEFCLTALSGWQSRGSVPVLLTPKAQCSLPLTLQTASRTSADPMTSMLMHIQMPVAAQSPSKTAKNITS